MSDEPGRDERDGATSAPDDDRDDPTGDSRNTDAGAVDAPAMTLDASVYLPGYDRHSSPATSVDGLEEALPAVSRENGWLLAICAVAVAVTSLLFVYSFTNFATRKAYTILFIGGSLVLFFLTDVVEDKEFRNRWTRLASRGSAVLMIVGAVVVTAYFFVNFDDVSARVLNYHDHEYYLAAALLVCIVEGTRRAYGWVLTSVVYVALVYAYFGDLFPDPWGHPGLDVQRILEIAVLSLGGVYGFITQIGATWVAIFIVLGGMLMAYGGMNFFTDLAWGITGRFRSGVAQIAIVSSMLMGTISGSSAANTAATGSFTIPLMKRANIRSESAAAIESVASSGGQMMPPVMGTAAFIIAEFLGISYVAVLKHGLLPAVLFYMSIAVTVKFLAERQNIQTVESKSRSELLRIVRNGWHIAVPLGILVYYLAILQYSPLTSGLYTAVALAAVVYLRGLFEVRSDGLEDAGFGDVFGNVTRDTVHGLVLGARTMAPIMIVLGSIALIIKIITATGINLTISFFILDFGSTLAVVLVLTAILSILFGMGMPTVAAYVLVAVIVVPTLLELGVPKIYSHFFVFYFAIISGITPPIAIVVAVAAGIADADFLGSAWEAMKIALPGYILPFAFVFNRSLLEWSSDTLVVFPLVALGLFAIIYAIHLGSTARSRPVGLALGAVGFGVIFANGFLLKGAFVVAGALVLGVHRLVDTDGLLTSDPS